jgi:serine/threonine-protein kinase HipA
MRAAKVFNNGKLAGILMEATPAGYVFRYDDTYFDNPMDPAISLTFPKSCQEYHSRYLFPFFANMLSEGHNRIIQAALHKLDREDDFGILLATAQTDTPGAITVKPIEL